MKYSDLYALLRSDEKAKQYYETLPEYVRGSMEDRAQSINSFESLKDYAQNLTRGEG